MVLSQNIQSTISEIDHYAESNGISFNSNEGRILKDIHRQQQIDAQAMASALLPEEHASTTASNVPYQWISTERTNKPLAIQTKGQILEDSTVRWIRQQADAVWNGGASSSLESRFTYQRKGNYEVHLADLLKQEQEDSVAKREIHNALQERIYPLVRDAFGTSLCEEDPSSLQFCVYDAIVIRYNATEAALNEDESMIPTESIGAGQPLHRDLGVVSVNVMLNSPNEFEGGGTFLEHQLQDFLWETQTLAENPQHQGSTRLPLPLKPMGGPGHALLHLSSDRHAGASTRRGVRDILVFFLTASKSTAAPKLEQAARLKSAARPQCEACQVQCIDDKHPNTSIIWQPLASAFCRARYQHLAVLAVPTDGEAWQYLGMALWDIHQAIGMVIQSEMETDIKTVKDLDVLFRYRPSLAKASVSALEMARKFIPCDARVHHNLAWILDQQADALDQDLHEQIKSHYSRAMTLHQAFQKVGCDVGIDYDSTILNYGLYLANKDLFVEALSVLEWIHPSAMKVMQQMKQQSQVQQEQKLQQRLGLIQDAQRLLSFCERQVS